MEKDTTIRLFEKPQPDSGKRKIAVGGDFGSAVQIAAALAIRTAGLPYQPVMEADEDPDTPYADVEFTLDNPGDGAAVQKTIRARLTFPERPEMGTQDFEAGLFLGGGNEWDAVIRHTPGFKMDQGELCNLLFDAYYGGSVDEDAYADWDELKYERRRFEDRMWDVATMILGDRSAAFRGALASHVQRFDPGLLGYPESPVEVNLEDRFGTMRTIFTPAGEENAGG